jgi:hypothetical protein
MEYTIQVFTTFRIVANLFGWDSTWAFDSVVKMIEIWLK